MRLFPSFRYRYHVLPTLSGKLPIPSRWFNGTPWLLAIPLLYLLAILLVRHISYRDPTSLFFNPDVAYEPRYSTVRQQQATTFIDAAERGIAGSRDNSSATDPSLCVGIASVARANARYFPTTVGSLLEGLGDDERRDIHLILFIAHSDPTVHPAYSEGWLHNVADKVLVYDLPGDQMEHIRQMESEGGLFREKALADYVYLLRACLDAGTPYIAMLEDDVVALDGWFHRTKDALERAEDQSALRRASSDFLYLRLFYTEEFLGWNSEDWPTYLFCSVLAVTIPLLCLLAFRSLLPPDSSAKPYLSSRNLFVTCIVCVPLCIILFFAAGKVTVLPLPAGVNEMNNFGCCSQGLVFPRHKAEALVAWYESKKVGFVDMLTEEYANEHGETRWALTPSVIQHVGRKSSKGDDFGKQAKYNRSVAEKLWNFAFEIHDAESLRKEHDAVRLRGKIAS